MKTSYKNLLKASVFALLAGGSFAACSDDHFDIVAGQHSATQTIWQNICEDPALTDVAQVLQGTRFLRTETDLNSEFTLAEYLNQSQTLTFFAPVNGSFVLQDKLQELAEIKQLREEANLLSGAEAQAKREEAAQMEYNFAKRFLLNHMARFSYEGSPETQQIRLLNTKNADYSPTQGLFNGIQIEGTFPSSNGTLHKLAAVSPFSYNIFDMMEAYDDFSSVYSILSDPEIDKNTFSESKSTEGAMNEDGDMVYVDSVYINDNSILDNSSAWIKDEDSCYVAIIPANEAWTDLKAEVDGLYKFKSTYKYDWSSTEGKMNKTINGLNADSLQNYNASRKIITSMFFTVNNFPTSVERDSASIVHHVLYADSLIATNGLVFYNPTPGERNPMLDGAEVEKASNGYVFKLSQNTIDPAYSYQKELEIKLTNSSNIAFTDGVATKGGETINISDASVRNDTVKGSVPDDKYVVFTCDGTMYVDIRLSNVLSGKYRVYAEVLPNQIYNSFIWYDNSTGEIVEQNTLFTAQIFDDNGSNITSQSEKFTVDEYNVKQYLLFDEVTFPNTYDGLPTGYESFPRLRLRIASRDQNKTYTNRLSVSRVILVPVREGDNVEDETVDE